MMLEWCVTKLYLDNRLEITNYEIGNLILEKKIGIRKILLFNLIDDRKGWNDISM